jgi:hypothetical protein
MASLHNNLALPSGNSFKGREFPEGDYHALTRFKNLRILREQAFGFFMGWRFLEAEEGPGLLQFGFGIAGGHGDLPPVVVPSFKLGWGQVNREILAKDGGARISGNRLSGLSWDRFITCQYPHLAICLIPGISGID